MSRKRLTEDEESEEYVSQWRRCQKSVFKLETMQSYGAEFSPGLAEFQRGDISASKDLLRALLLDDPAKPYDLIRTKGLSFERIHIVDLPLSEYIKYEIQSYLISEEMGEKVFFVRRNELSIQAVQTNPAVFYDFLLFDDNAVILQTYDSNGAFQSSDLLEGKTDVEPYVKLKEALFKIAVPMCKFLE